MLAHLACSPARCADTFALLQPTPGGLVLDETGIAWASDRSEFRAVPSQVKAAYASQVKFIDEVYPALADVTDEHFIVWMRPAALPTFRKLYGRIRADVPAGVPLRFTVAAAFPVAPFGGAKELVLASASALGGRNLFLPIACLAAGGACVACALLLTARAWFGGRQLADPVFLRWPGPALTAAAQGKEAPPRALAPTGALDREQLEPARAAPADGPRALGALALGVVPRAVSRARN